MILRDLSPAALSAAIEENEIAYWLYRAQVAGWEVHETAEATTYISGQQRARRNGVLRMRLPDDTADLDARIAATLAPFAARGLPMVWWTGPSRAPDALRQRLRAHGLEATPEEAGMAVDLAALRDDLPAPSGLTVERVRDRETVRLWLATNDNAPLDVIDERYGRGVAYGPRSFADDEPNRLYLARLDGEPVGTAELLLGGGVAGIYSVGTLPAYRRRGIGAAVTLAALRAGRALGYRAAVLGATEMGEPLYRRLGFQRYCMLGMYIWQPGP